MFVFVKVCCVESSLTPRPRSKPMPTSLRPSQYQVATAIEKSTGKPVLCGISKPILRIWCLEMNGWRSASLYMYIYTIICIYIYICMTRIPLGFTVNCTPLENAQCRIYVTVLELFRKQNHTTSLYIYIYVLIHIWTLHVPLATHAQTHMVWVHTYN